MILSSADILRILGRSEIIRLAAKVEIVEGKPALSGREGLFIYIKRYPELDEFEATFTLWIESDGSEPEDIVVEELKKLLPRVQVGGGLMTEIRTVEFRSQSTLEAPQAAPAPQVDISAFDARFEALVEDIQDQMLLVHSGRNGRDGRDGRDGVDGRDGRDLAATEATLEDLQNVEQNIAKQDGQVLTWKDGVWQNLFIPQVISSIAGDTAPSSGQQTSLIGRGEWRYDTDTTGDPANGRVQFNDADPSLATEIYINRYTSEGKDIYNLLTAVVTAGTLFYIQGGAADNYYLYDVTANAVQVGGTHILVPVTLRNQGVDAAFSFNQTIGLASYNYTSGGGGIPEAPQDGNYYVRQNASWVLLTDALTALNVTWS